MKSCTQSSRIYTMPHSMATLSWKYQVPSISQIKQKIFNMNSYEVEKVKLQQKFFLQNYFSENNFMLVNLYIY